MSHIVCAATDVDAIARRDMSCVIPSVVVQSQEVERPFERRRLVVGEFRQSIS